MESILVRLEHVHKKFGHVAALTDISLTVPRQASLGLVGPNGAGKSTLLNILAGTLACSGGRVARDHQATIRQAAMLEAPALFELLTGREQLQWVCSIGGEEESDCSLRIAELSSVLALDGWLDRPILEYSKGVRRKLAFAATVITDPRLLILDEPFEGIDMHGVMAMKSILAQFKETGATMVISSHLLSVLQDACDTYALLSGGRIMAHGGIRSLQRAAQRLSKSSAANRDDLGELYLALVEPDYSSPRLKTLACL